MMSLEDPWQKLPTLHDYEDDFVVPRGEAQLMVPASERDAWKAMAERLAGALKFYGNKKSYESLDINRATGNSVYDILLHDFDRDLEPRKDYAGRRAREALAEFEKFRKEGE